MSWSPLKWINDIWEYSQKQVPEWNAPETPKEGVSKEEKNEQVDYRENKKNER